MKKNTFICSFVYCKLCCPTLYKTFLKQNPMKLVAEPKNSTSGSSCDSCAGAQALWILVLKGPKSSSELAQTDNRNDDEN